MYQTNGSAPAWWVIEIFGSPAEQASWMAAARLEGHRLVETVDGEGRYVLAA